MFCCAAGWPAQPATGALCSHWAGRTLLQCHRVVPLHCTHSTELLYSMSNPARHPAAFPFPHCTPFLELEGFLGVDCQIAEESCDLWSLGFFGGKESVRFHHLVAVLYHTCKCLTLCILDSSGRCALSWLWKHIHKVSGVSKYKI